MFSGRTPMYLYPIGRRLRSPCPPREKFGAMGTEKTYARSKHTGAIETEKDMLGLLSWEHTLTNLALISSGLCWLVPSSAG